MNADPRQKPRPCHQPETVSTASVQSFDDPEGGLPLDSPEVRAREEQRRGRPAGILPPETGSDGKPVSPGA